MLVAACARSGHCYAAACARSRHRVTLAACARLGHRLTFISSGWSVPVLIIVSASIHRTHNAEQRGQCNYNPINFLEKDSRFSTLSPLAHCCSGFSQASTMGHYDSLSMELCGRMRGHIPLPFPPSFTNSWLFSFTNTYSTSSTTLRVPTNAPSSRGSCRQSVS